MYFLELKEIRKSFPHPAGKEGIDILCGIDLRLSRGGALALVGPSGSGKSTLLNIAGTLDSPSSGQVLLEGRDLAGLPEQERARIRNREIGFVFQLHHLLPQCTVLENVLVPALARSAPAPAERLRPRAEHLLQRVGLADRQAHFPAQLSGGELQRVAVARALIHSPKLLLADEPTGSLDLSSAEELARLLLELNREEDTALMVATHSHRLAAAIGTIYSLRNGRLEQGYC